MENPTPTEVFKSRYITSIEVRERLSVTRTAVHHRRSTGALPGAIELEGIALTIWERDFIEPYIRDWEVALNYKRAAMNE